MKLIILVPCLLVLFIAKTRASSDINVCLKKNLPIKLYNYQAAQCLTSTETRDNTLRLQDCVGGFRVAFYAARASSFHNTSDGYILVNKFSGNCLTAGTGGSLGINTPVVQAPCNATSRSQVWKNQASWQRFLGSTYYQISDLDNALCLTADEADISLYLPMKGFPYMFPCSYNHNMQWWLPALGEC